MHGNASREYVRGVRVPEVVQPARSNPGCYAVRAEGFGDPLRVDRPAERIGKEQVIVLVHVAGLHDGRSDSGGLALMCKAWNHPSFQELERLLPLLGMSAPKQYRAIVGMYVHPRLVRRAVCPRCGLVKPPNLVGELHQHGNRKSAAFVARMVRVPLYPVEERDLTGRSAGWTSIGLAASLCPTNSYR